MADSLPRGILKDRFSEWYRKVSIDPSGELLEARRQSVELMAANLNIKTSRSMVAYAHGRKSSGEGLIGWINDMGLKHDPSFSAQVGDLEPRVMVACAIAHRLVSTPTQDTSVVFSLLTLNARFCGFRSAARSQDLPALATQHLEVMSDRAKGAIQPSETSLVKGFNTRFAELGEVPAWDAQALDGATVASWLRPLVDNVKEIASRVDNLERSLARHSDVNREELDQTAWLLDDYCELGEASWNRLKDAVPLLAGAELAAITEAPNTAASGVMVRSALLKGARDPNADAKPLDSVGRAAKHLDLWPGGWGHVLMPLSAALDAWREKGRGATGWRSRAQALRGGGATPKADEGALADQSYREFLLANYLAADA